MSFVHLHLHSTFSFGDGACRIDEVVAAAGALGMQALAVTDHEGLYGAVRFYQACRKAGIKPIVGVELTVEPALGGAAAGGAGGEGGSAGRDEAAAARRRSRPPEPPAPPAAIHHLKTAATIPPASLIAQTAGGFHLVLLAKDYAGWSNLCRIISAAHLEHPGEPPLARLAVIREHADHLIALSACRRGEIASLILQNERQAARLAAQRLAALFRPGDFFIELQNELLPDSDRLLTELNLLAHELRLPTVATNDVHYTTQADAPLHDVLAAEAANQPLPNPLGRKNAELYLKSPGQMWRLFRRYPEAYTNAARIAARCNLNLGLGQLLFPAYPLPPGETAYSLLCKRCFAGAQERYSPLVPAVLERLNRELKVIEELGFAEYFLAVHDIVTFARQRGILYSGRGSAGNSIVSYVLRITDADPIEHELLFERFLNPARREMPDIDIDFDSERRDEVIAFIYERFGADKVAMVATVATLQAPSAVRVVAKAYGYRPGEVNRLSQRIPWGSASRLREMLAERPELADHDFQHPHYGRLVELAQRLADFPAHLSTHLGGFILARDKLTDRVPLQWAAKGVIVAQFDKDDIETLGLVKMDILGLKMHSAIAEAVERIAARMGERIDPWLLPRDDPAVYELIRSARTVGVFQLESSGQRNLATRLRERTFEDIIAAISLFRPGPLQAEMIGPFIRRRHGREPATVPHPALWPALRRTYGVILYQEQVIEVAAAIAGFSLAEGDLLRRAMTHDRSMEEMDELGRLFIEKAVANGIECATAEEVFRQLRGFAAYGFNKAHAACFAIICNASAWLKAHYPAEFFCGILNNQPMGFYSPRVVLNDARRWGLEIRPLDVNLSQPGFSVEEGGRALRVGLQYVKEMTDAAMQAIVAQRAPAAGGPYRSLSDFCLRTRVSREIIENLVRVGAFDALGVRREELLAQVPLVHARLLRSRSFTGQQSPSHATGHPIATLREHGAAGGAGGAAAGGAGGEGGSAGRDEAAAARRRSRPPEPPAPPAAVPRPTTPHGEHAYQLPLLVDEELTPLPFVPSWTTADRVRAEIEILGLNVSEHPLALARADIRRLGCVALGDLAEAPDGTRIRVAGVLERAQMPWIRSGHRTLFLTLEDETGMAEVVVFNDVFLTHGKLLKETVYLLVEGELQNNAEHGLAIVATRIDNLSEVLHGAGAHVRQANDRTLSRSEGWLPKVRPRTRPGRTG